MEKKRVRWAARLLRRAGLAPAGRVRELTEALARAEQRTADLKREFGAQRDALKMKIRETQARLEEAQRLQSQADKQGTEETTKRNGKVERELQRLRERDAQRAALVEKALKRVHTASHTLRLGREHLMMIEVKLDIVEGAIKVLDQRTRLALAAAQQHTESESQPVQSR